MIKELKKYIKEYKKASLLAPFFVILEVVMEVIIPFIMAKIIDLGIEGKNSEYILKSGLFLIIAAIMSLIFGMLSGKYAAAASCGFAKNIRRAMYHNVQEFSFSNIDKFSTSGIVTRLTTDVTNLQMAYQMIVRVAVRCPIMLILALFAAISINAKLSIIFAAVIPVLIAGLILIAKNAHPIFEKVFKTYDKLNNVVEENLRGIRVVKSFVSESYEENKFGKVSGSIYNLFVKAEAILAFNSPLMQFCVYGCMILLSWFGAKMIVASGNTGFTTGGLTSMFTYTMQILMSLMMFSFVFVMIIMSKASAERIIELLTEKSSITNPENPVMSVSNGDIEFKNVSFSYKNDKNKLCLRDINIKINSGETIGIIGGTGSAKSTLIQLISRLYDATLGEIYVGGRNVKEYDLTVLRDAVATVLQKNVLFSGTIRENLRWGNKNATDEEIAEAAKLAQADGFINQFPDKYDTYIEQGGSNVSGGQRQRLCIARALLKKPKILILDDSTSAVDTKTDALIQQSFKEFIPETTKIIIAQRVSSICDADKIIVMDGGKISGFGTHNELLKTNKIYSEVYALQTGGVQNE